MRATALTTVLAFYVAVLTVGVAGIKTISMTPLPQPLVVNTWPFLNATIEAWRSVFVEKRNAIDSVVKGCSTCEEEQCDGTVGYGGSPDENGETTLDAMIMDGVTMNVGAVGDLRRVKDAIAVAKAVLVHTKHTFLVGDQATQFAEKMGFRTENLTTENSVIIFNNWIRRNCQPNYWVDVYPNPRKVCGPYSPNDHDSKVPDESLNEVKNKGHDTIGMIVIDSEGDIAAGTSTNGMRHKIPGRIGDSPIPGSGAYADNKVGAASATGDGDIFMRFLPSFLAVEEMRRGKSPKEAADVAINRIVEHYPDTSGALIAVNMQGDFGAACCGMKNFTYCVANKDFGGPTLVTVDCVNRGNSRREPEN